VIKKLDALIIKAFIGPFFATFLIGEFVLILQFFWLYIDDLIGKGLDILTILNLIVYVAATVVPYALPIALLLSSIMTFGNLGESYELVAIKSAGISLLRFMRPLLIVAIGIGGIAFLFSNNIIPIANLKLNTLKYDIIVSKPAFDIKEGVFYDKIDGYVIKIGQKEADGSTIKNIIIYEKNYSLQDFSIVAESGKMSVTADKKFLVFDLVNGWRYQEKGNRMTTNTEYIRLGFKTYKKVFDLSSFKLNKTADSTLKDNFKMLSIRQLTKSIDSLQQTEKYYLAKAKNEVTPYLFFGKYADSTWPAANAKVLKQAKTFDAIIPDSAKAIIADRAVTQLNSAKNGAQIIADDYATRYKDLLYHQIEWHRKLTLSVACVVLFLIGAPLGSIIRKGGLGTPLVFAVIFFVFFHLFNTFGEKFVKEQIMSPFGGMWLSTAVLIPIGFFLTYKALRDSQLFNQEFYYRTFKQLRAYFRNIKSAKAK
jgi:lipopolysaccharide export system permease protein